MKSTKATLPLIFHSDPGHGWLAVPLATIQALGVAHQISQYSYQYEGIVYLEEDRDATLFVDAAKAAGIEIKVTRRNHSRSSSIRAMSRYVAPMNPHAMAAAQRFAAGLSELPSLDLGE